MLSGKKRLLTVFITACILTGVIILLHNQTRHLTLSAVGEAIRAVPPWSLLGCLFLTCVSFFCLALYEILAIKVVAYPKVSLGLAFFTGASANAVANTLGFHAFTGGAWRYRVYSSFGLSLADLVGIISVSSAGIGLSFCTITALAFVLDGESPLVLRVLGAGGLCILCGILFWIRQKPQRLSFRHWSVTFPSLRITGLLILAGIIEMAAAIGGLYVLLPAEVTPTFAHFTIFYVSGILLGIVSSVPGGIGVFEATLMTALGLQYRVEIVAALMLYRLIYNVLPFLIAAIGVTIFEIRRKKSV